MERIDKWMMLVIGLVGGWVISTAPGWLHASSHKDWWDIATAIGTVGASLGAFYAARVALKVSIDSQKKIDAANREAAISYLYGHISHFTEGASILAHVEKYISLGDDFTNCSLILDRLQRLNASLSNFDFNKAFLVHKKFRELATSTIRHLRSLEVNLQMPETEKKLLFNTNRQSMLRLEMVFLRALIVAVEDIAEGREGWETYLNPEYLRVNWTELRDRPTQPL